MSENLKKPCIYISGGKYRVRVEYKSSHLAWHKAAHWCLLMNRGAV